MKKYKLLLLVCLFSLPLFCAAQQQLGAAASPSASAGPSLRQSADNSGDGMPSAAASPVQMIPVSTPDKFNTLPVAVSLRPQTALFGRSFDLEFELPVQAKLDLKSFDNKDFEIVKQSRNQLNPLKITLTVMSFNIGIAEFPQTTWIDAKGQRFFSDPFRIETKPTDTKVKTKGLVDIRPPYKPFNPWNIISVIFIVAAVLWGYEIYRRRKAKKTANVYAPYAADNRPYHVIALEQIGTLMLSGLWEEKNYKAFYIRLTDILRDYLSARFEIQARNLTTRDLLRALRKNKDFKADEEVLEEFLKEADYVKFAKVIPTEQERDKHIAVVKNIIEITKQPDAPQPSADTVLKTDIQISSKREPQFRIFSSEEELKKIKAEAELKAKNIKDLIVGQIESKIVLKSAEPEPKENKAQPSAQKAALANADKKSATVSEHTLRAAQSAKKTEAANLQKANSKPEIKETISKQEPQKKPVQNAAKAAAPQVKAEGKPKEKTEVFSVFRQPERAVDLKVGLELEKQGLKYARAAENIFGGQNIGKGLP